MNAYEVLKASESALKVLMKNNVDAKDVGLLEVYEDYKRLMSEGHKKTYIVAYLVEQYGVGEATIYRMAKRMERKMNL